MYAKYHTDALVLGGRSTGEADKLLVLFTRDFGLIRARASAIRSESSRMRYALQNYSHARVALVRGIRGWRVAGAVSESNMHDADVRGAAAFARIGLLVGRLVGGEEKNEYLFDVISEARRALSMQKCEAYATIELVCVARALFSLGYLSAEALGTAFFANTAFGNEHLSEADSVREKLLASVNKAISESHL